MAEANAQRNMKGGDEAQRARAPRREQLNQYKDAAGKEPCGLSTGAKVGIFVSGVLLTGAVTLTGCETTKDVNTADGSTISDVPEEETDGVGPEPLCDGDQVTVHEGSTLRVMPDRHITIYAMDSNGFGVYESDSAGNMVEGAEDIYITVGDSGTSDQIMLSDGTVVTLNICDIGVDPAGNSYARVDFTVNEQGELCPPVEETTTFSLTTEVDMNEDLGLVQDIQLNISIEPELLESGECIGETEASLLSEQSTIANPPEDESLLQDGMTELYMAGNKIPSLAFDLSDEENPEILTGKQFASGTMEVGETLEVGDVTIEYLGLNEDDRPMFTIVGDSITFGPGEDNSFYLGEGEDQVYLRVMVNDDGTTTLWAYHDTEVLRNGSLIPGGDVLTLPHPDGGANIIVDPSGQLWELNMSVSSDPVTGKTLLITLQPAGSATGPSEGEARPAHPSD